MKTARAYQFLLVLVVISLSFTACNLQDHTSGRHEIKQQQPIPTKKSLLGPKDFREAVITVAKANIPAVVHIEVTQRQEIDNPFMPFGNEPFFRRFFDTPGAQRRFKRELKGIGTGMIINSEGFILTNNHVVGGATEIRVILSNESEYPAKVIGIDPKTDLAVIRVPAKEKLPFVVFGDSDKVEVGEWVVAIGHPRGLDQTVTQGIISAKHRQGITDPSTYQDFLQTDAAINPGNSGGPLLNLDGQVIGVNSIIASQSGGFEGIGFAIPSNMAIHIARSLMDTGKVERGWLGLSLQDVSYERMKSLKLDSPKGAFVVDSVKGSPAHGAGVKPGDIITSFEDREISDSGNLRNLVAGTPIGKEVKLGITRNGKKLTIPVKVGNPEQGARIMASNLWDKLGVDVRGITEDDAARFGIEKAQGGVIISRLDARGPMAIAGFETGDIILQINELPIESPESLAGVVSALDAGSVIVLFAVDHRTGRSGTIQIKIR